MLEGISSRSAFPLICPPPPAQTLGRDKAYTPNHLIKLNGVDKMNKSIAYGET